MSKKKKQLTEIHGKFEDDENVPTTLEAVWGGYNELARYGTLDPVEYEQQLAEMNQTDLHAHARSVGLVPIDDSNRLKKNLLREFNSYAFYLRKPVKKKDAPKPPTKDVSAILAEGR